MKFQQATGIQTYRILILHVHCFIIIYCLVDRFRLLFDYYIFGVNVTGLYNVFPQWYNLINAHVNI